MARYPAATWDPLGPQTAKRMLAHDVVCLHTMVGTLVGTSSMFHKDGYSGTESHFGMGADGATLQWQDLGFRADANYNGNPRVISMETADKGPGFPTWSDSDVPAWTPQQVDRIVDWLLWATSKEAHRDCPSDWLCHQVGIPRVLVPDTKPGRRGIAYHRQGVDSYPALYKPGWRQPGGELWSASRGKVCPGDRRIHQLTTVIIPRVQAATAEEDDVMTPAQMEELKDFVARLVGWLATGKENTVVRPADPDWAFVRQPGTVTLPKVLAAVKAGGADVDEAEVARVLLASLTPESIAQAIDDDIASEVADLLAARLAG